MSLLLEAQLIETFAGAQDQPLWRGVMQAIETLRQSNYKSGAHQDNSDKEMHMFAGGANTLDALEATLKDYAAKARAKDEAPEDSEK